MRTLEEAKHAFKSVPITDEDQKSALTVITAQFDQLVEHIYNEVPSTADRTAAVRKLLEAKWTCVQAVTHDWSTRGETAKAS